MSFKQRRHLHERSLRIVYKDNYSSYVDLLAKDKSFTIHQKNIQSIGIELFKVKQNLSNVIMCNILKTRTLTYNLRSRTDFMTASIHDVMDRIHKVISLQRLGYNPFRNKEYKFYSKI